MQGYQGKRLLRASAIHGLAGSAAIMASTYKAYLGEGLGPLGKLMLPLKIPHPGKVCNGSLVTGLYHDACALKVSRIFFTATYEKLEAAFPTNAEF